KFDLFSLVRPPSASFNGVRVERERDTDREGRRASATERDEGGPGGGAVAFGYLSFQVGFKPYLEEAMDRLHQGHPSDGDNPTSPPGASSVDVPRNGAP
ncbi:hypothetical protein GW17_00030648, partial [Ensete ventricosum]